MTQTQRNNTRWTIGFVLNWVTLVGLFIQASVWVAPRINGVIKTYDETKQIAYHAQRLSAKNHADMLVVKSILKTDTTILEKVSPDDKKWLLAEIDSDNEAFAVFN